MTEVRSGSTAVFIDRRLAEGAKRWEGRGHSVEAIWYWRQGRASIGAGTPVVFLLSLEATSFTSSGADRLADPRFWQKRDSGCVSGESLHCDIEHRQSL